MRMHQAMPCFSNAVKGLGKGNPFNFRNMRFNISQILIFRLVPESAETHLVTAGCKPGDPLIDYLMSPDDTRVGQLTG